MNKLLPCILFLCLFAQVKSQKITIGFQTGIADTKMSDLKSFNASATGILPFDTKLVSDFPPYWYYRPSLLFKMDDFYFGLVYTFQSTGSRISAKDYSGEYRFDMKINSNSPGLYAEVLLGFEGKLQAGIYSILGVSFSNLKITEYSMVLDSILTDETYKFKAQNNFFEPGINLRYLFKSFDLAVNAGYHLQFSTEDFYTGNNKDNKLMNPHNGNNVKPDWSGLRLGLSIYYNF